MALLSKVFELPSVGGVVGLQRTTASFEQVKNAPVPILVAPLPIVTLSSAVQFANA